MIREYKRGTQNHGSLADARNKARSSQVGKLSQRGQTDRGKDEQWRSTRVRNGTVTCCAAWREGGSEVSPGPAFLQQITRSGDAMHKGCTADMTSASRFEGDFEGWERV